jgi:hypothetical protein
MPRSLTRMLGWLLLAGTIGVVSCQALFTSGSHTASSPGGNGASVAEP